MTRSVSTAPDAIAPTPALCVSTRSQAVVRLGDLDVAPENLRHGEAPDDDISQLADTIAAAGLLQLPTVRPGRRGEAAYMVLDGRRRLLALRRLRDGGFVDDDHLVEVFVETDRARQAAATVLTNTAVPVHVADVVAAIGRMLRARLGVKAIARALGYGEIEIRRLAALSKLPAVALEALKTGRITLRQARLLARLKDAEAQAELAQAAFDGHGLPEWRIQEQLGEGRITNRDPRCGLVTPERYAAEGGRTEADLFGELPSVLLDPEALTRAWLKRAAEVAAPLEAEGLTVHLSPGDDGPDLPEDLEQLYYAYGGLSDEATLAYREARERAQATAEVLAAVEPEASDEDKAGGLLTFVRARIAQDQAGAGQKLATVLVLRPSLRTGLEVDCYGAAEAPAEPISSADDQYHEVENAVEGRGRPAAGAAHAPPRAEAPAAEVEGISHVLHATRTDTATRGLIRALAEAPEVALTTLVARLFGAIAIRPPVGRSEAALAISASAFSPSGGCIVDLLDGVVRERLDERRRAWEASGLTMLAWVHAMEPAERMALLAELTALSLDLREDRTSLVRKAARSEAAEIADLCHADIARWWTPDGAYLRPHSREQLLTMLEAMGAETEAPARMRKGELIVWTEDQARTRSWAPACLSWGLAPNGASNSADVRDAPDADVGGRPDVGEAEGDDRTADLGVGVFVATPAGEAALAGADPVDAALFEAVPNDAAV
ncbi:MAG TPA: ParB N-terminal domain-containing protein [Brevundimonas sp.]